MKKFTCDKHYWIEFESKDTTIVFASSLDLL